MEKQNRNLKQPIGSQKTHLRTSKLSRAIQSATARTNWTEMAKILFSADDNLGRRQESGKLISLRNRSIRKDESTASYSTDQLQYTLLLMLVLTTAEKRTQELYQERFASRCDAISNAHSLKDDQYWADDGIPPAWKELDAEFERCSLQILIDTLREYQLNDLADRVQTEGSEQLFEIIRNIESQFLTVLKHPDQEGLTANASGSGSLPETLQSALPRTSQRK